MQDGGHQREHPAATTNAVFIMCTSRSGSTLLRFLLDAHPELACPPETQLPFVLAQLCRLWSAIESYPPPPDGEATPAIMPQAAAAGIRHTMDQMIGPYLARRGKKRYCDKNLGTEEYADTLAGIFPDAKFIALYRHPMDMIASGIDACPWGLGNYSFEKYAAWNPGNAVLALAKYWSDHTTAIMAAEQRLGPRCHRVRYEDLAADPDGVAERIFRFLHLSPVPGVSRTCFSRDRERFGPGDYKIWNTSRITTDSIGRGWSVPANLIPDPDKSTMNAIAEQLCYVPVGAGWGTERRPADLRLAADGSWPTASLPTAGRPAGSPVSSAVGLLADRLEAGLRQLDEEFIRGWKPHSEDSFVMVAMAPDGADSWWHVDLAARKTVTGTGTCDTPATWNVSAPASAWEDVIRHGVNLGTAFRRLGMRYRDRGDAGEGSAISDLRVAMMSDLLSINSWRPGTAEEPAT